MFKQLSNKLQLVSWLAMNIIWYTGNVHLTTIMIIPTLLLTGYMLTFQKDRREENFVLTSWVLMNIMWLLHEIRDWSMAPIFAFMFMGVTLSFITMKTCLHIPCKKTKIENGEGYK